MLYWWFSSIQRESPATNKWVNARSGGEQRANQHGSKVHDFLANKKRGLSNKIGIDSLKTHGFCIFFIGLMFDQQTLIIKSGI